ncbi:CBS domain-containing protein [Arthrobacter sp. VKM Ac-2550]|nr:CBS domain-containing protein [Arthrobacter sp. VKM Ac-2550]
MIQEGGLLVEIHAPVTARDIMTTPVISVAAEALVEDVAQMLGKHRISAVPVVDNEQHVVGLVSEYDLLATPGVTAAQVMTSSVISVTTETAISDIRQLLVNQWIARVPVLENGRLVGIVSRADIVALLATEWVCGACGEPVRGEHPPKACPKCGADSERFVLHEQPPGP